MTDTALWLDDITIGDRFRTDTYDLTTDAIIDFATAWDPQPFHLGDDTASNSQILWIGSRQATSDTGVSGEGSGVMSTGRSRSLPLWNTAP
ncbi:hypothetical protein IU436_26085, partial [Nocardia farcinica]|nr:hypothetical protein [Nocardia farcinica]MBF6433815.1 hypothetical protein [Nocardia farcinica]MBF6504899.1 hypothetical protein [Nocardia farcinica]